MRYLLLYLLLLLLPACSRLSSATSSLPQRGDLERQLRISDRQAVIDLLGPPDSTIIPEPQLDGEQLWCYTTARTQHDGKPDRGITILLNNATHPVRQISYPR